MPIRGSRGTSIRAAGAVAAVGALLALPSGSHAATVVGSDFSGSGVGSSSSAERVFVQDTIEGEYVETPDGVITSWRTFGASGTIGLRTYRATALFEGELHADWWDNSDLVVADATHQQFATRIPVDPGDYIALYLASGAGATLRNAPGEDTWLFQVPPDEDPVDRGPESRDFRELFLQATVEPDADGDGFGDESQDGCPTNASTQGACPTAPPPPPPPPAPDPYAAIRAKGPAVKIARSMRASKAGAVPIRLTNPYAFALRGKLTLKRGKKTLGKKSVTLPPRGSKAVRVRLGRTAFRALRRRGRLSLSALARMSAPVGKARTTRAKLTVRPPKKKRKRRTTSPRSGFKAGRYDGTWTSSLSSAPGSAPLTFTVSGGRVTSFTTKVDVYCSGSFGGTAKEDFKPADSPVIAPDGTFSSQVKSPTSHRTTLTYMGKVSPDGTAKGSLRLNKFNSNAFTNTYTTCNAAGSWSART